VQGPGCTPGGPHKEAVAVAFGVALCLLVSLCAAGTSYAEFVKPIRANDVAAICALASDRASLNAANRLGARARHYAATCGSVEAVNILLKARADPRVMRCIAG
jgi:hypothetical protein